MIPTAAQVYDKAQILIGDDEVSGGDVFTDAYLATHLETAHNTLYRTLVRADSPLIRRRCYYTLAAQQGNLDLDDADLSNLSEIISIRSKPVAGSGSITALAFTTGGWDATSVGHGLSTGDLVYLRGVATGPLPLINSDWRITVADADEFKLLGSPNKTLPSPNDTYGGSGGVWTKGSGDWSLPYNAIGSMQDVNDGWLAARASYDFREDALRFEPDAAARLLEIYYREKRNTVVATYTNLQVRGSLDCLAYMTAGLAMLAKGADNAGSELLAVGCGARSLADIDEGDPGGLLGDLAREHATAARRVVYSQRFRPNRRYRVLG